MKKTIRAQIMLGYLLIVTVPIIITAVTIISLFNINSLALSLNQNREHQNTTKDAIVGHYSWIMELGEAIQSKKQFTGSLDPAACGLGKWMAAVPAEDLSDSAITGAINQLKIPHDEIHSRAKALIDLSKTDRAAAYAEYEQQLKPKVSDIIVDITVITNRYADKARMSSDQLTRQIITLIIFCVVLVIAGVAAAVIYGLKTSRRISRPIELVADFSLKLAQGDDDLNFSEIDELRLGQDSEVSIMISAFERMVGGVQENVSVVKRVASGDLTAYVDIRSSSDSLGRNLYHMVQSNDLMFGRILRIASEVASSANQISQASNALADSATVQASSTEQLSITMEEVNDLTLQNQQKVAEVTQVFDGIRVDVSESGDKMAHLVTAVDEIRAASDKISVVIKTIDDLAFQTNILALNAAVEAARAGAAGKGFAVVADEVRNLANKSASAADETKAMIEDTISKAYAGSQMAKETGETFGKIDKNLISAAEVVGAISEASQAQVEKIETVYYSLDKLLSLSTTNAASCEQSSAASHEMYLSAGELRGAMEKFNLRQRQYGKAYIPPEKANDLEFIKQANENYRRAIEQGFEWEKSLDFVKR